MAEEFKERGSERVPMWVGVAGAIVTGLGAMATAILDTGALEQWPVAVVIASAFVTFGGLAARYIQQRPAKHEAMAARVEAEARLTEAKAELMGAAANPR